MPKVGNLKHLGRVFIRETTKYLIADLTYSQIMVLKSDRYYIFFDCAKE